MCDTCADKERNAERLARFFRKNAREAASSHYRTVMTIAAESLERDLAKGFCTNPSHQDNVVPLNE